MPLNSAEDTSAMYTAAEILANPVERPVISLPTIKAAKMWPSIFETTANINQPKNVMAFMDRRDVFLPNLSDIGPLMKHPMGVAMDATLAMKVKQKNNK